MESTTTKPQIKKQPMSKLRKNYMARLVWRILVLIFAIALFVIHPESKHFDVLEGWNFFKGFSIFHILWVVWIMDMACQLIPIKDRVPLGSQKLFSQRFIPAKAAVNKQALKMYVKKIQIGAGKVIVLWIALIGAIATLYYTKVISREILLLIGIAFYVSDLICVLIWCPFRLIQKTRCCTTCRIFNWDHMMMFSPMVFMGGFYAVSLFTLSMIILFFWEMTVLVHPERFWEGTNDSLKCINCTDKLCTQFCKKMR